MTFIAPAGALTLLLLASGVGFAVPVETGEAKHAKRQAEFAPEVTAAREGRHGEGRRIGREDAGMSGVSVSSILALMGAVVISRRRFGLRVRGTPEETSYSPYRIRLASGHEGQRGK